jgi:hypothetical protein
LPGPFRLLGGSVGNQDGIRSAALLGFHVPWQVFVAMATPDGFRPDSGARQCHAVG